MLTLGMAVMLLAATACSASTKVAKPSPPPGPNPDVIPAVITPSYVNAVFKVLNHVYGNALREEVTIRRVDNSVVQDLQAIYSQPQLGVEESIFQQALANSLSYVTERPGDRVFTTRYLEVADPLCIQAREVADYSAVDRSQTPDQTLVLVLERSGRHRPQNPTPWSIVYEKTDPPQKTCPS